MSTKRNSKLANRLDGVSADKVAAAQAEDAKVSAILRRARAVPKVSDAKSGWPQQNAEFMAKMRLGYARSLAKRIECKELVSKDEFIALLGGRLRWVNDALRAGRLFSIEDALGQVYFPAFFADASYDRRALGKVTHALEGLPGESKYFFFTRKSTRLRATPMEALAQGRTMEVVSCALAFADTPSARRESQ